MRLLQAESIELRRFEKNDIPPYAILSHTWEDDEVSFQDIQGPYAALKAGCAKIEYICRYALWRDIEYVWVDTCCIHKSSSAELSEAINSMFRWYKNATYCYAYLADVPDETDPLSTASAFATSRWFTRGWTVQEPLAPAELQFFSCDSTQLNIPPCVLRGSRRATILNCLAAALFRRN
ncbi:heterokaryon incompatibility protein-domain-containing protein [Hyaloscypha sp. PMI_1271]|nr:heterokaryon incompatibility protein-domain-containing protein [Hyaloscypha sp. PMI_1271]